jgi:hypothetical protein
MTGDAFRPIVVWAILAEDGRRIQGGDYRLQMYWTRRKAQEALPKYPGCKLGKVLITSAAVMPTT